MPIHQIPPTSEPTQRKGPTKRSKPIRRRSDPTRRPDDDDATPRQLRRRPPESVFGRGRHRHPQIGAAQHQSTHSHPRPKSDRRTIEPTTDGNDRTEAIPPHPNVAGRPADERTEPDERTRGGRPTRDRKEAKQSNTRERYIPCLRAFTKLILCDL